MPQRGAPGPRRSTGPGPDPGTRSWLPQLAERRARSREKLLLPFPRMHPHRPAKHNTGEHRHRERFALGQDAVQVVEVDRHRLELGPLAAEMIEAALEGRDLLARAPGSLGEHDER